MKFEHKPPYAAEFNRPPSNTPTTPNNSSSKRIYKKHFHNFYCCMPLSSSHTRMQAYMQAARHMEILSYQTETIKQMRVTN